MPDKTISTRSTRVTNLHSLHCVQGRNDMKHSGLSAAIAIGLFITAAQAYAQEPACSLKTVKGRYLFSTSGTILPPAFGVSVPTPGASAGVNVFNGDGTGTATVTVRVNGSTFLSNAVVPLSYTV